MYTYLLRRILQMIPVLVGITLIVFLLVRLTGDPVVLMLGEDARLEDIERLRVELGLDRPLYVQYGIFMQDLMRGEFGVSYRYRQQALPLVLERLPATGELALASFLIAVVISIPAGVISALRQYSIADYLATNVAVLGQAMPNYWLGIMLILLFSVILGWLPASGRGGIIHLILPALTLGTALAAVLMRLMRSAMLEVMRQDFVTTARSKGLSERVIIFKHAMRNALIPYVTVLGLQVAVLLGGAIITEQVFAWPGMGRIALIAVNARDMSIVQAVVFVMAMIVMLVNFLVDIIYAVIDPRIHYS